VNEEDLEAYSDDANGDQQEEEAYEDEEEEYDT
jgi:hypothetical protein